MSYLNQPLSVRPTRARRELGNLLVVAPTRGGKGLLATAQLLCTGQSVIVNDIKGTYSPRPQATGIVGAPQER